MKNEELKVNNTKFAEQILKEETKWVEVEEDDMMMSQN